MAATSLEPLAIEFTRFSAFYSPLIATIAGGFLKDEGFTPTYEVSKPGRTGIDSLVDGSVQVAQSAPSNGFGFLEKGKKPPALHFAQINEMDGFFITGRNPEPHFSWANLKGKKVLVDLGGQPNAMFRYCCHKVGLNYDDLIVPDIPPHQMDAAFRRGEADYIHQQGPAPQQIQHDGVGYVVAQCGPAIGPCAFSSIAATPAWLATDAAKRFTRAYRKGRAWLLATPAAEVAKVERPFFPDIDPAVLTATIAAYQRLGNWTPHIGITREGWEHINDIFLHSKLITRRHPYEDVIAQPPA